MNDLTTKKTFIPPLILHKRVQVHHQASKMMTERGILKGAKTQSKEPTSLNKDEPKQSKSDRSSVYNEINRRSEPPRSRNFNFGKNNRDFASTNTAPVKSLLPLKGLKSLKVTGLQLKALPNYLFRMNDLESLHLSPERSACLEV